MTNESKPSIHGFCDCGRAIADGETYAMRVDRRPVYGRIGQWSSEITGFTRGTRIYRCESCLAILGPLT